MFKEKFKKAVDKYIAATFPIEASRAKAAITKVVNSSTELNTQEQIQEVLSGFDELPEWIKNRFTPGSLYKEGGLVFGWHRENQVQAEVIPATITSDGLDRESYLRVTASRDGLEVPVDRPEGRERSCRLRTPVTKLFLCKIWLGERLPSPVVS
jgi:hypothetical protein